VKCISLILQSITSTNSWVNLNADVSKPRFFPGEIDIMKPKSMCIMWPSESSSMLPLCLKTQSINQLINQQVNQYICKAPL